MARHSVDGVKSKTSQPAASRTHYQRSDVSEGSDSGTEKGSARCGEPHSSREDCRAAEGDLLGHDRLQQLGHAGRARHQGQRSLQGSAEAVVADLWSRHRCDPDFARKMYDGFSRATIRDNVNRV